MADVVPDNILNETTKRGRKSAEDAIEKIKANEEEEEENVQLNAADTDAEWELPPRF